MIFDAGHIVLAVFAFVAVIAAAFHRGAGKALRRRLSGLEGELSKIKEAPERLEYRVERFDALWFPIVVHSSRSRQVLQVIAGLPHCRSCAESLTMPQGQPDWLCGRCGTRYPASLTDLMATDLVAGEALRYFNERHPGWGQAPKK